MESSLEQVATHRPAELIQLVVCHAALPPAPAWVVLVVMDNVEVVEGSWCIGVVVVRRAVGSVPGDAR